MKSLTFQSRRERNGGASTARRSWRLWVAAFAAAAVLVTLAVAFAMLLSSRKTTLDALVIVTIPSGAEVIFDGASLGPAPVRLEGVRLGSHVVRAEKEGFTGAEVEVSLDEDFDEPVELKLKPMAPPGSVARTPREQIEEFTALAEDAFGRGDLVVPADRSALYYADAILSLDAQSAYAAEMRERIRTRLLTDAHAAAARKDLPRAKEAYGQLLLLFPGDADSRTGLTAIEEQLRREQTRVEEFVARGRKAFEEGRFVEPQGRSALSYAARALAVAPENPQALALRKRVRDRLLADARAQVASDRVEPAVGALRRLVALFPEDRAIRGELDALLRGDAALAKRERRDAGSRAYRAGSYREAIEQLEAAARLGSLEASDYAVLGQSHLRLGNAAEARRALERAVLQDGRQVEPLVTLASLAERRGERAAAARYLRRAAALGGTPDLSRERLESMAAELDRKAKPAVATPDEP